MTEALDLDAYFARVGWDGPTTPSYATLAGLLRAHMSAIPFENLDVLLGRPVRLDLEALVGKLVHARRGGYCFEHATLFAAVLERVGFAPVRHSARVTLLRPRTEQPRTHMFLTVPLPEGTFVVDPGFGTHAPARPVPVGAAEADAAPTHWIADDGPYKVLRVRNGREVIDAWASTFEADHPADFEMANHYTATWPESAFRHRVMLRALIPGGRVTVANRDVTITRDGVPATMQLADRAALRALLAEHFGFDLPAVLELRVPTIPEWD